jgi:hypothetical protein
MDELALVVGTRIADGAAANARSHDQFGIRDGAAIGIGDG